MSNWSEYCEENNLDVPYITVEEIDYQEDSSGNLQQVVIGSHREYEF